MKEQGTQTSAFGTPARTKRVFVLFLAGCYYLMIKKHQNQYKYYFRIFSLCSLFFHFFSLLASILPIFRKD